jgi:hypothetical protein
MKFFGVTKSITSAHTLNYVLHFDTFLMLQKSPQLEITCESYASHKLTYLVDHHVTSGFRVSPHYSHVWGYPHVDFQEYSRRTKLITN